MRDLEAAYGSIPVVPLAASKGDCNANQKRLALRVAVPLFLLGSVALVAIALTITKVRMGVELVSCPCLAESPETTEADSAQHGYCWCVSKTAQAARDGLQNEVSFLDAHLFVYTNIR
jgi:hypothetical protein